VKADLAALTIQQDDEAEAQKIIHTSKPIYWITSGFTRRRRAGRRCWWSWLTG